MYDLRMIPSPFRSAAGLAVRGACPIAVEQFRSQL